MDWTSLILLAGWGAVCNVWAALLFAQRQARRRGVMLVPETPPGAGPNAEPRPDAGDSVCIIIPARNEADTIAASLTSVLTQDYPRLSAVVIDDRSTDGTGDAARKIAAADPRLRVQTIDTLPPGWLGKSHALWTATRGLNVDWLLFIDADCTLFPGAVRTAIVETHRRNVTILSLWPRHLAGSFWEQMLIPLCAAVMALWFGRANNAGTSSRCAFANGQFILIRRDAYERIGGHRAVRRALIEDVPLAEHAARKGLRCWTAGGRDLVGVRMYKDFAGIADGWSRIFVGALRSRAKLLLSIAWLLVGSLLPFVAGPYLLYEMSAASRIEPLLWAASATCLTHLLLIYIVSFRFWVLGHCDRRYLLLYPLSVVVVVALLLRATWWLSIKRIVGWRTTYYNLDSRAMIVE
jgi:chlorobactene glucosyltransferase